MEIYLFPLPQTVVLPGMSRPLNIFEPRYIEMVYDSIANDVPVVIGNGHKKQQLQDFTQVEHESLPFVNKIAGYGRLEIIQKREDGSLLVIFQCQGKVEILAQKKASRPYIICEAKELSEDEALSSDSAFMYKRLQNLFHSKLAQTIKGKKQRDIILSDITTPSQLITFYTDFLVENSTVKQSVLSASDINEKVLILSHYNTRYSALSQVAK
jgi:Lon protease-like protein